MPYPNMLGWNRLVFDSTDIDYSDLKVLLLSTSDKNKSHQPLEGELSLEFTGPTILSSWRDISIMFNEPSVSIQDDLLLITCSKANPINIRRAKALLINLSRLTLSTKPTFVYDVGPGNTGDSDSSDEDVPLTLERTPLFASEELGVIQHFLEQAWVSYQRAISGHFSNGPGKFFMDHLATYLGFALTSTRSRFESSHSTTLGGSGTIGDKETQAGSSTVTTISLSRCDTRVGSRFVCSQIRRYSDVSTFDHLAGVYVSCGEIKSTLDSANFQNLEQMLGLWRSNQKYMLGWTINPDDIYCRILVRKPEQMVELFQLRVKNNIENVRSLAKLYLASILIVDTTC